MFNGYTPHHAVCNDCNTVFEDLHKHGVCFACKISTLTFDKVSYTEDGMAEKELVVGWYHSHPNLGAFFSGTDRYNQKANFNSFFHVGVVIDPVRDEKAAFTGQDSTEVRSDCFIVGNF